jgi:molybdopterin-guanine dinucleotide biosynthesis protein B
MVALGIVGAKNSGKTAVMEGLIQVLIREGYRVATIKHTSHRHRFDTPGKDSFRHRQAGAGLTIAISGEEVAVFARPDLLSAGRIQAATEGQFDIWLIEGDRQSSIPKILLTRNMQNLPSNQFPSNIIASMGPERFDESVPHFADKDYRNLGSFVVTTFLT